MGSCEGRSQNGTDEGRGNIRVYKGKTENKKRQTVINERTLGSCDERGQKGTHERRNIGVYNGQ